MGTPALLLGIWRIITGRRRILSGSSAAHGRRPGERPPLMILGREPLPQRTFGMQLTAQGFQRRRRGKGKHWWTGIGLLAD